MLLIANETNDSVRCQVSAVSWDEAPDGRMLITPTKDVLVFPQLLTLKAGEDRNVRVGTTIPFGTSEKTYRIVIQELPAENHRLRLPTAGLQVLVRFTVPVFLAPAQASVHPQIENIAVSHGGLSFSLHNVGTMHARTEAIRATAKDAKGEPLFDQRWEGWYLLAGRSRDYAVKIPPAFCEKTAAVTVEASTDGDVVKTTQAIPAGACGP